VTSEATGGDIYNAPAVGVQRRVNFRCRSLQMARLPQPGSINSPCLARPKGLKCLSIRHLSITSRISRFVMDTSNPLISLIRSDISDISILYIKLKIYSRICRRGLRQLQEHITSLSPLLGRAAVAEFFRENSRISWIFLEYHTLRPGYLPGYIRLESVLSRLQRISAFNAAFLLTNI
jgi:hypothetical protein